MINTLVFIIYYYFISDSLIKLIKWKFLINFSKNSHYLNFEIIIDNYEIIEILNHKLIDCPKLT